MPLLNTGVTDTLLQKQIQKRRHPDWLKVRLPSGDNYAKVKSLIKTSRLHTICEEAKCPNLAECWSHGTATFLILGNVCTRWCGYCNVKTGKPYGLDLEEPKKVADAVKKLNLKYVVITSVTRDDLEDGGASIYAQTVREIKKEMQDCSVELLIPDLKVTNGKNGRILREGVLNTEALKKIVEANPDVLAHNIEAVRRVFAKIRPGGSYGVSLELLGKAKEISPQIPTKSGIMIGFGETFDEIRETMQDLRDNGVDFLTLGQYLQPSVKHAKIEKYYTPHEFEELRRIGYEFGFRHVEAGPLVRSSYRADKLRGKMQ